LRSSQTSFVSALHFLAVFLTVKRKKQNKMIFGVCESRKLNQRDDSTPITAISSSQHKKKLLFEIRVAHALFVTTS